VTLLFASPLGLLAADDGQLFLGKNFFPWMILAFGAAMVVGNVLALVRPPGDSGRAPVGRATAMIVAGLVASAWGIASLLSN
jgi:hypothetical protein